MRQHGDRRSSYFYGCVLTGAFISICFSSHGQYAGFVPVQDVTGFKRHFASESAKVLSLTSEFTQEKTLTAITEKITSSGNFWFRRSNKVRLEYTHPFVYLLIMNGDKMFVRDHEKENRINVKSSKVFQQLNSIMIECVQGTILDSKNFTSRAFENDKRILLEMTPVSKALGEFFKTILLTVDKTDYSAFSIVLNEPQGDHTEIYFMHKKLNEPIPDSIFAF